MNQKLIKLSDNHYIIVDGSEIKDGDWYCDTNDKESLLPIYQRSQDPKFYKGCKKITHSTQTLSEECKRCTGACEQCVDKTKPLSLSEVEEVIYGYSIDKIYDEISNDNFTEKYEDPLHYYSFVEGFKVAVELNKDKLFTIEDMRKCWGEGFRSGMKKYFKYVNRKTFRQHIKLILTKTEWDIEVIDGKIKLI